MLLRQKCRAAPALCAVLRRQRRSILFLPLFNPLGRVAIAWSLLVTLADFTYTALVRTGV